MIENKKEQQRKDNDQNDFRAMLDKAAKQNSKKKGKKIELGVMPEDIANKRQQQQAREEKIKPEIKLNSYGERITVQKKQTA